MMATNLPARREATYASELVAAASAYPSEVVSNRMYLDRCRFALSQEPEALIRETRMRSRRWCMPHETTATLARAAVGELLQREPQLCAEIDAVVVASGTTLSLAYPTDPENPAFADIAPLLLQQLGREQALGIDIKACYCTGFLRGLQVADGLLSNANYRAALVLAVEHGSRFSTAATNRSSFCFIVGDAAGAVVMRRCKPQPGRGIVDYVGYTDASKLSWVGIGADAASIIMLGSKAAQATQEMLVDCARTLLSRNGLHERDVTWFIPIQTHAGLLDEVLQRLEFPRHKLLWQGDTCGFSGSASIPACLADQLRAGTVKRGDLILSVAVGAGLNCAGALYHA
jgi:3-oxoacyl-[acyl-carrier-protein] synthase-3